MKKCIACGQSKDISEFYKHSGMKDGHLNKCIICIRAYVKQWRNDNLDYVQDYDRKRERGRYKDEQAYRLEHKEEHAVKAKEWQLANPEKRNAHNILNNAIRDGLLVKQPCERCGATKRIHGHHDDYSKPLTVMWLCPKHHGERHKELNEIERNKNGS